VQLADLDASYRTKLSSCAIKDIVTSHAAFGYLAAAYGLTQVPIAGLSPESEPSPTQLASIASFAKKNHVTTIFFESLVSPKLAETIANEVGAKTMVLDPIEGLSDAQLASGATYITQMTNNLTNLTIALQCAQ
jgi:zinc transport system substrate-binding protein